MGTTPTRDRRRRERDLRPEYLALGLLAEGPAHGYELLRRFRESLGGLWHISESQFYATLKRAEARGLVGASEPAKGDGAAKRLLTITAEGRRQLRRWIEEPTAGSPRLVHMEFLARLHFARRLAPAKAVRIVAAQAASLSADLARARQALEAARVEGGLSALSAEFRERQLRAALAWIEEVVVPSAGD